jgi:tripartite-type tricarboxylate transporter receptor subunit TctC
MKRLKATGFAAALVAVVLSSALASFAQDWPSKPVKIVVAFAPGGAADLFARMLTAELSNTFRQQFYVENIAGSAGAIASGQVSRALADGYTILIGGSRAPAARASSAARSGEATEALISKECVERLHLLWRGATKVARV